MLNAALLSAFLYALAPVGECLGEHHDTDIHADQLAMRQADNCVFPFEIVLVQDTTSSFERMFERMANEELNLLLDAAEGSALNYYGLISFKDKPVWPLGNQPTAANEYSDYCHKVELDLCQDKQPLIDWYHDTQPQGGGDPPENQFGALFAAAESFEITWTLNATASRLIILITDSVPHFEGDEQSSAFQFKPFSAHYDQHNLQQQCLSETYPSAGALGQALQDKNIKVASLITDETEDGRVMRVWKWFNSVVLHQPDFFVVDMNSDGHDFSKKVHHILSSQRIEECGERHSTEETADTTKETAKTTEETAETTKETAETTATEETADTTEETAETTEETAETTEETAETTEETADTTRDAAGTAEEEKESTTEDDEECELHPSPSHSPDQLIPVIACLDEAGLNVVSPNDLSYFADIIPYNLHYAPANPTAIVYAESEADVQRAMRCASEFNVPVVPRSGSHDYASYSFGQDGSVVVDLHKMTGLQISESGLAQIQPGIRAGTLAYEAYYNGSWFIPEGSCIEIGFGGHALGGGYGYFSRAYGIVADHIKSMRMVNYRGDVLVASPTENSDLYWALAGSGNGNFGIVTQFEVQMIKTPPVVTAATYVFSPTDFRSVLIGMLNLTQLAPRELGISMTANADFVALQSAYIGSQKDMSAFLEPYFANIADFIPTYREADFLTAYAELSIKYMLDTRSAVNVPPVLNDTLKPDTAADEGSIVTSRKTETLSALNLPRDYEPVKTYFKCHSLIWSDEHPFDETAVEALTEYYTLALTNYPTFGLALEMFGGNTSAIREPHDNSWPWRDSHWIAHWYSRSFSPLPAADVAFVSEMKFALRQSAARGVYVNYHDDDLRTPLTDYYGDNLSRLQNIKAKYDPDSVFWFPQVIINDEEASSEGVDSSTLTDFVPSLKTYA